MSYVSSHGQGLVFVCKKRRMMRAEATDVSLHSAAKFASATLSHCLFSPDGRNGDHYALATRNEEVSWLEASKVGFYY